MFFDQIIPNAFTSPHHIKPILNDADVFVADVLMIEIDEFDCVESMLTAFPT